MMEILRNRRLLSLLFFIVVGDVIVKVSSFTAAGQATEQQPQQQESLLIFGLGRVGRQVATLAHPHFKHIAGTVRRRNSNNKEKVNQHEDESSKDTIECIPISLEDDDDTNLLSCRIANASHILIAMPPDDKVYSTILQECSSTKQLQWLGMISTTSVYGNHNGSWVNESSPVLQVEVSCNNNDDNNNNPNSSRSSNSLDYLQWEERFQNNLSNTDASVAIFRCAGIYDASKSALHTLWKRGYSPPTTTNTTTRTLTNRIHVLDIAHAIVQSMMLNTTTTSSQSRIYNLADDCPASRSEVLEYAAQLFDEHNISLPQQQPAAATAATNTKTSQRERRRETDRKLVDNTRMKMELLSLSFQQQQLKYPTYKEGLSAIFHDPMAPWWEQQREKGKRSK
eukprot:scaffold918_cov126-Cylindrotheca_fusiformis.AAC.14